MRARTSVAAVFAMTLALQSEFARTTHASPTPIRPEACVALALSPQYATDHTVLCAARASGTDFRLYTSKDSGHTWAPRTISVLNSSTFVPVANIFAADDYASSGRVFLENGFGVFGPSPVDPNVFMPYSQTGGGSPADLDFTQLKGAAPYYGSFAVAQGSSSARVDLPASQPMTGAAPDYTVRFLARPTDLGPRFALAMTDFPGQQGKLQPALYTCLTNGSCPTSVQRFGLAQYMTSFLGPSTPAGDTILVQTQATAANRPAYPGPLLSISTDGGKTMRPWVGLMKALRPMITRANAQREPFTRVGIAWDPRNSRRILVRAGYFFEDAILRSDDGGATFRTVTNKLPWGSHDIMTTPAGAGRRLWITSEGRVFTLSGPDAAGRSGFYCSRDLGASWQLTC